MAEGLSRETQGQTRGQTWISVKMLNPLNLKERKRKSDEEIQLSPKRKPGSSSLGKSVASPGPCGTSLKSDGSMGLPIYFQRETKGPVTVESPGPSGMSVASDQSMSFPLAFHSEPKRPLVPMCCVCEEGFEDEPFCLTCSHTACPGCVMKNTESKTTGGIHCPLCGTSQKIATCQALGLLTDENPLFGFVEKFKIEMLKKFSMTSEGNGEERTPLNHIYTSLSIHVSKRDGLSEHYIKYISMPKKQDAQEENVHFRDIFDSSVKKTRTLLTNGVAGIGKSFSVQRFIVDWAEGLAQKDVHFIFCLAFRELNLVKQDTSLLQLLKVFHPALTKLDPQNLEQANLILILDGFDESRFHLDFTNTKRVTSVQEVTSVSSLMLNLIQGNLLPSAQLWITSRPVAAHQIPGEYIHTVTEIQGFNDRQKEEYFKQRFMNKPDLANMVIAHIMSSQTLELLCQIPIFCWMSSVLFEEVFGGKEQSGAPQTLTDMMAAFLSVQTKRSSRKYDNNPENERIKPLKGKKRLLLKIGELAFIHLLKNSLIFYEEDLQHCGLDPNEATVKSGFFNSLLKEEQLFQQQKVYFFVHLIIQEFFAALYVYDCFTNNKSWAPELSGFLGKDSSESPRPPVFDLLKMAVDKVLEKNSGHLYLFQRFLLGLLLESNQRFIHGLLVPLESSEDTVRKMLSHLKAIRRKTVSPDACINLFQTMVEMGDIKISEEIQEYLKCEDRARVQLTPLHCSALAFTMQTSKSVLQELDMNSYNTSVEGRRRLIPAVRSSRKANLSYCRVTESFLKPLSLALMFPHSSLRDLELSNNDLRDTGVQLLCEGLTSPDCKLTILRLSGCLVTKEGCGFLVSALKSNPSHLKELDLSYNHVEESGAKALTDLTSDPQFNLSHLQIDMSNGGSHRMIPGLKKYACALTWDSACSGLQSSDGRRSLSRSEEGPDYVLVRGRQGLSGCSYWEISASEPFNVGVTYWNKELESEGFRLGQNQESWSFVCSDIGCYAFHNNRSVPVSSGRCSRFSRLAVYLDHSRGVLSFFRVSEDSRMHLYTFKEKFNDVLFAAAELKKKSFARFYHRQTGQEAVT